MEKISLKPSTLLFPLPAVMVSCAAEGFKPNIITISWIGIVCSEPPTLSISVTKQRHSFEILKKSGEFVVNLTSEDNLKEVDFCGTKSGRDFDKFKELGLTAIPGEKVNTPIIGECPINLECKVIESKNLGSHDIFIAEIVTVRADKDKMTDTGKPILDLIKPLVYCPGARTYMGRMDGIKTR